MSVKHKCWLIRFLLSLSEAIKIANKKNWKADIFVAQVWVWRWPECVNAHTRGNVRVLCSGSVFVSGWGGWQEGLEAGGGAAALIHRMLRGRKEWKEWVGGGGGGGFRESSREFDERRVNHSQRYQDASKSVAVMNNCIFAPCLWSDVRTGGGGPARLFLTFITTSQLERERCESTLAIRKSTSEPPWLNLQMRGLKNGCGVTLKSPALCRATRSAERSHCNLASDSWS